MFQTRSEETGMARFATLKEAIAYANEDPSVWKISFGVKNVHGGSERIRLVRFPPDISTWVYAPITDVLDELFNLHEKPQRHHVAGDT